MGDANRGDNRQAQKASPRKAPVPVPAGLLARPWIVLFLLSLLAVIIYTNALFSPFQFDDIPNIVENPRIRSFSTLPWSESRYLGFLSFALNYHFGRLDVFGFHLVNLAIHIANGFLVYTLILSLFKTPQIQSSLDFDRSSWIALAAALLFVAHPIQTQAVTYITQRYASLAAFFYLLAVVVYIKSRTSTSDSGSRSLWYAGALLSTVLAMKTKEITFTLPFMLLLVEAIFFGSFTRKRWIGLIPFLLTLLIIPLSPLPEGFGERGDFIARETTAIGRMDYLLTQFSVISTYLRLLILPIHQNLDYDYPIYHSLFEPKVFFSFLFLSALMALTLYFLFSSQHSTRSGPFKLIGFGLLWFFLTLSIESSIIPIEDVILEHRLYLPSVGFFLAVSVSVLNLIDRQQRMNAIAIGVLVAVLCVATYERNLIWKDELTLWSDVVRKSPDKKRGHIGLGNAYEHLGRLDEAAREYKTASAFKPDYAETHNKLGTVYEHLGRFGEAAREYKTALTLKPDYAEAHNNLGIVYKDLGRLEESLREFQISLKLKPDDIQPRLNLGNVYRALGRPDEAIQEYKTALTLRPDYAEAHNNIGLVYKDLGLEEAVQESDGASPDDVFPRLNLGNVYRALGRPDEAIQEYKTALTFKPEYVEAHNNLGVVYKDLGRLEEAVREFQTALKLNPDAVHTRYSLGQAYQQMGRTQEAIREFEFALQIKPDYEPAKEALKSLHR
jgi:tetratricopeptide (TPR) repeat protein